VDKTMGARGVTIVEGRAVSVLESLSVRDAMVTDHEIVYEQESVSAIYPRLAHAKYPFFPVYNSQHVYSGLLTADVVAEAWRAHDPKASHMPLSQLLEAKDLLYRYGLKPPTVKMHDRLTMVTGLFDEVPCVPVLGDRGEVVGLLFIHNVRFSYECGVAHHSLLQNLGR
jgi:predicted transcriptional regulator